MHSAADECNSEAKRGAQRKTRAGSLPRLSRHYPEGRRNAQAVAGDAQVARRPHGRKIVRKHRRQLGPLPGAAAARPYGLRAWPLTSVRLPPSLIR